MKQEIKEPIISGYYQLLASSSKKVPALAMRYRILIQDWALCSLLFFACWPYLGGVVSVLVAFYYKKKLENLLLYSGYQLKQRLTAGQSIESNGVVISFKWNIFFF